MTAPEAESYARKVIEAMREPTKEMLEAGAAENDGDHFDFINGVEWKAMIDEALNNDN